MREACDALHDMGVAAMVYAFRGSTSLIVPPSDVDRSMEFLRRDPAFSLLLEEQEQD